MSAITLRIQREYECILSFVKKIQRESMQIRKSNLMLADGWETTCSLQYEIQQKQYNESTNVSSDAF